MVDVSSIARWAGPAVGILRAQQALASYALSHRPDIVLSCYDSRRRTWRRLQPRWAPVLIGWEGMLDVSRLPDPLRRKRRLADHLPVRLQPLASWLSRPRRQLIVALERVRLTGGPAASRTAARMQWALFSQRNRRQFADREGNRRSIVPIDLALAEQVQLGRRDTLITAGLDWTDLDIRAIRALKRERGCRYVAMCYDILPLLQPQFFDPPLAACFRDHWLVAFPLADRVLFSARRVESDVRDYCAAHSLPLGETAVVPLGFTPPPTPGSLPRLPANLAPGRFALYVSTVEPRKGHDLLLAVWNRLIGQGIPERYGFRLVLVGRMGWRVEALQRRIAEACQQGWALHLGTVSDDELATLYAGSAFCLYPSRYEGYGLPVVEAFSHGKAVLASTGGALPEVVGEFSPCLDPDDEETWTRTLAAWISTPATYAAYEAAIRARFRHPSWEEAAARFFSAAEA